MARIKFIAPSGEQVEINARGGMSVMEAAVQNDVEGIEAECGGGCSCGTCHVYVDPAWVDRLPPRSDVESDMLEAVTDSRPESRLTCQVLVNESLDGLVLYLPEQQG